MSNRVWIIYKINKKKNFHLNKTFNKIIFNKNNNKIIIKINNFTKIIKIMYNNKINFNIRQSNKKTYNNNYKKN